MIRACRAGMDVADLQRAVLRSLRRLMSIDAAFFATADPQTLLLTGAFAEEPLAASTPLFLDNEFGSADVNRFAALAVAPAHVASLDGATRHHRTSSRRYVDIMRPIGLGDELRAALVAGGRCWGYLCLHRADDPLGFTPAEVALVGRLAPHIAHALRLTTLRGSAAGTPGGPGVVLLADDLSVVASTPEADHLLSLVDDRRSTATPLPMAVHSVAAVLDHGADLLPSTTVRTRTGHWLNVHASRMHGPSGEGRIAVVVEPAEPRAVTPVLLAAHGLTARESEVAVLVLRGTSTRAISDTLHISPHTVQDHLKSIFDKTGVRSRRDLVGLILTGPG